MNKQIIGITGLIGSGKDTAASYLFKYGFQKMSFAGTLKDCVAVVFGWDRQALEGATKESREWREQVDPWWSKRLDIPHLTPRWVLQNWGTEVCRKHFHDDIWVASLENQLRKADTNVVITDCRFINEIKVIRNHGGKVGRIFRGDRPDWYMDAVTLNTLDDEEVKNILRQKMDKLKVHASEYSSVGLEYDFYLDNNSSLEYLNSQLEDMLNNRLVGDLVSK